MGHLMPICSQIRIEQTLSSARIELVLQTGNGTARRGEALEGALNIQTDLRHICVQTAGLLAKLGETQLNFTNLNDSWGSSRRKSRMRSTSAISGATEA
jgi:hypothetical protein